MNDAKNVPKLEAALLERAERLAAEYIDHGRDGREAILKDERERLRIREERTTREATAIADRLYRRRVQAAQLRLQGLVEQQRWELIRQVAEAVPEHLLAVADEPKSYEELLRALLGQAADTIGEDELVAQLNARDLKKLKSRWKTFAEKAAAGRSVALDPQPIDCSGGIRVSSRDDRVCVDATFEGRTERFEDELLQTIAEHLFAREVRKGS